MSLKEFYDELTDAEMLERQEFAFEAAVRMRDRFLQQEVWERMGVDVKDAIKVFNVTDELKNQDPFQQLLFSKIVPNCKKLGLLDANDGWLRKRFDALGVIQFEDWADTGEEYESLDEVAKDRAEAARLLISRNLAGFRHDLSDPSRFRALSGERRDVGRGARGRALVPLDVDQRELADRPLRQPRRAGVERQHVGVAVRRTVGVAGSSGSYQAPVDSCTTLGADGVADAPRRPGTRRGR